MIECETAIVLWSLGEGVYKGVLWTTLYLARGAPCPFPIVFLLGFTLTTPLAMDLAVETPAACCGDHGFFL